MSKSPPTRASLLVRLQTSADGQAWGEFVEIYAPLIHAFGLHRGLQDADAADLAQEVLQAVVASMGRFDYDPSRGSFRGWLFTITRNKLRNRIAREKNLIQSPGGTAMHQLLHEQPDGADDEAVWAREHQKRLFQWAADRVRNEFQAKTWDAFWKTAVEDVAAPQVAEQLGMTVGAVYIAKSRVLTRLREVIAAVEPDEA